MLHLKQRSLSNLLIFFLLSASLFCGCDSSSNSSPNQEKPKSEYSLKGTQKLRHGDLQGALQDYDRAIAVDSKDAEAYLNRGIIKSELGKPQDAIADYSQSIQLQVDSSIAYYNRANAYHQLKQYSEAIKDYSTAIKLTPDYAYAYANRAASYFQLGSKAEAKADLKKAIEIFTQKSDHKNSERLQKQLQKWEASSTAGVP